MRALALYVKHLYWRWMLAEARQFRHGLENTIVRERIRAQHWVEHAELMARRAELAAIAARIDRNISARQSTQGAKP